MIGGSAIVQPHIWSSLGSADEEFCAVLRSLLTALHVSVCIAACTLAPGRYADERAEKLGFERSLVAGNGFQHVVYLKRADTASAVVHVYLEGDGSPWIRGRWISTDPGPREPLMLGLMALDSAPSLYLGRPCYHGLSDQTPCDPALWTHGRYSDRVVQAMAQALEALVRAHGYRHCVLIGYSGGGTLAMLLAERVANVLAVVTLAGNLDPDAWARHHDYSPLLTSLNPAQRPPLPERIYQLHLAAENDDIVPPELSRAALLKQPGAEFRLIPDYDHVCCWHELWPSVLAEVTARFENRGSADRGTIGKS
jgi:pimeloyl-ACP methyl ester carboxylesterase